MKEKVIYTILMPLVYGVMFLIIGFSVVVLCFSELFFSENKNLQSEKKGLFVYINRLKPNFAYALISILICFITYEVL